MWKPDDLVHRLTGRGTKVKAVSAPPVKDEWLISIAKVGEDYVKPVEVPCFWTFVNDGVWTEGDEGAEPGEKVIMYVNGGYVILIDYMSSRANRHNVFYSSWVMGHPQSTMFPYKFAKISGCRILGRHTYLLSCFFHWLAALSFAHRSYVRFQVSIIAKH